LNAEVSVVLTFPRLLLIFLAYALSAESLFACRIPVDLADRRVHMAQMINQERQKNRLRPLKIVPALEKSAQDHACDNANQRQISHQGSDGSDLRARFRRAGYRFHAGNENVGNYPATLLMFQAWMNSPGHKANILDRNVTELGVGVAMGEDNRHYWVTDSGAP